MKQINTTLMTMVLALLMAMVLTTAVGAEAQTGSSTVAPSGKKPPAVTIGSQLIGAETDFHSGRYGQAVIVLRRVLARDAESPFIWGQYNRAVLAAAGDGFLQGVPKDRFRINVKDFINSMKTTGRDAFLLDVREPREFARGNVPGSVNIPFRDVFGQLNRLPRPESGRRLIIICQTQHRANHVLVTLREIGYDNAFTLRGGYSAYISYLRKLKVGMSGTSDMGDMSGTTGQTVQAASGNAAAPAAGSGPTTVAAGPVNRDAVQAGERGQFDLAVRILRSALKKDSTNSALWHQYDQALLTMTGAGYLCMVPDNRYRLDIGDFVDQYRTHGRRFFLVDVREPSEFARGHIRGSVNIPFRTLMQHLDRLPQKDSSKILLIISSNQRRAIDNLVILRELGYRHAFTLHGGYRAFINWMNKIPAISNQSSTFPAAGQPGDGTDEEEEEDWGC